MLRACAPNWRARRTAAMVIDPVSAGWLRRYIGELQGELHRRAGR